MAFDYRHKLVAALFSLSALVAGAAGCSQSQDNLPKLGEALSPVPAPRSDSTSPSPGPAFPLRLQAGKRYLVDAAGKPFFIHGDTAWSLMVQLTREQAEAYLEDRRLKGFNTILVNLLESHFATNPPKNAYGVAPFTVPHDYSKPNEDYFAHIDFVVAKAAEKGLLVMLTPSYLGFGGGEQGWYREMIKNGSVKLTVYGRYLGNRYQKFVNIIWVHGGDFNPPSARGRSLVRAIARSMRSVDPTALHTFHGSRGTAALQYWGVNNENWLTVNNIYTNAATVVASAFTEYARSAMPFFLLEAIYENEGANDQLVRAQAYQAVLSGAAGHLMGNSPIWKFSDNWLRALDSAGARSMTSLRNLFEARSWWLLQPDTSNSFITVGVQAGENRAVASRASDSSFAIVYLPSIRTIEVTLSKLAGPLIAARWYDPTNAQFTTAMGSPFLASSGSQEFTPASSNSLGAGDWILVLDSTQQPSR